jgi:ABC-2 type transport system permease protein
MKSFLMLIRRELWEHRMVVAVPVVISLVTLLGVMLMLVLPSRLQSEMKLDNRSQVELEMGQGRTLQVHAEDVTVGQIVRLYDRLPAETKGLVINGGLHGLAASYLPLLAILMISYLLDCLYKERKDRSVLFWKSLPISDAHTVLSKLATGVVVIPLITVLAIAFTQLLVLLLAAFLVLVNGGSIWQSVLGPAEPLAIWLTGLKLYGALALYYMPLLAWLLLASAWARKLPFLHAVVPPVLLIIGERLFLGSTRFAEWLGTWLMNGFMVVEGSSVTRYNHTLSFGVDHIGAFVFTPGVLGGLVVAGLMVAGSIRIRRWRELG